MSLLEHAERELKEVGLFDKNSDYDGMLGEAVLELIRVFANQGHSGMSARMTLDIFNKLVRFKTLTLITSNPDEWEKISADIWQLKKQNSVFSKDGGKTWYDIDEPIIGPVDL